MLSVVKTVVVLSAGNAEEIAIASVGKLLQTYIYTYTVFP